MAPDLSFGPPGEQWHYDRSTKTYDLSRGSGPTLTVKTTQGPADTSISIAPSISAMVIVDMQNYFLHPDCRDHPTGLAAVEPTLKMIEKCRELGIQIIWLNWGLTDEDLATMPASVQRSFSRTVIAGPNPDEEARAAVRRGLGADLGSGQGRCLVAGEWNAAIYGPLLAAVRPEDVHCAKNRMSGMWNEAQPLWRHLAADGEGRDRRTLLFSGVNTDQCVLGTLTSAYQAGWDCVLLDDCTGTPTPGAREVCLRNIAGAYGFVTDSAAFLSGTLS